MNQLAHTTKGPIRHIIDLGRKVLVSAAFATAATLRDNIRRSDPVISPNPVMGGKDPNPKKPLKLELPDLLPFVFEPPKWDLFIGREEPIMPFDNMSPRQDYGVGLRGHPEAYSVPYSYRPYQYGNFGFNMTDSTRTASGIIKELQMARYELPIVRRDIDIVSVDQKPKTEQFVGVTKDGPVNKKD